MSRIKNDKGSGSNSPTKENPKKNRRLNQDESIQIDETIQESKSLRNSDSEEGSVTVKESVKNFSESKNAIPDQSESQQKND